MTPEFIFVTKAGSCAVLSAFMLAAEAVTPPVNQYVQLGFAALTFLTALLAFLQGRSNARAAQVAKEELVSAAQRNKEEHNKQIQELRITVDGKLTKMVDLASERSLAQGKEIGRVEEKAGAASIALAKAEGKAEGKSETVPPPPTNPTKT